MKSTRFDKTWMPDPSNPPPVTTKWHLRSLFNMAKQHGATHGTTGAPKNYEHGYAAVKSRTEHRGGRASRVGQAGPGSRCGHPPHQPRVSSGKRGWWGCFPGAAQASTRHCKHRAGTMPDTWKTLTKLPLPGSRDANSSFIFRPKTVSAGFHISFYAGYLE